MQPTDDSALLRRYAENNSDEAFAALVTRHVNLVYSVALRQVANPHHAEEITQAVFIILARNAASLRHDRALSSWLFQATRLTAGNFIRSETRRHRREEEAYMQSVLNETGTDVWPKIAPLLDDAVAGLREQDRQAIVLRFYEGRNLREVGLVLGASEAAAEKRVNRAVEKLRKFFSKRGVTLSSVAITGAISANSVQAAPVALAKAVTAIAVVKGTTASASTLTLIQGALKIMAWTKAKTLAVTGAAIFLAASTMTIAVVEIKKANANEVETYFAHWDSMDLNTAALPDVVVVRPSKYANQGDYIIVQRDLNPEGRIMRRGASFHEILSTAYGFSPEQMVLAATLPRGRFDMLLTTPKNSRELLRAEIKRQFGIVARPETRDIGVLILKVVKTNAPGLKISSGGGPNVWTGQGSLKLQGYKMADAAHVLGTFYNLPVIDETGLTNNYDIDAKWNANLNGNALRKEIESVLRDQFGLEMTPDKRPIEMLVVGKAK